MLLIRTGERYLNCEFLRGCSDDAYVQQHALSVDWDSLLKQVEGVFVPFCWSVYVKRNIVYSFSHK